MTTPVAAIRQILPDNHATFHEGLVRRFEDEPDLHVVGPCATPAEALALLNSGVSMVILDVDPGATRVLAVVEAAHRAGYQGQILVVTAGMSGQETVQRVQAGVAGILHKHHSAKERSGTIRRVAAGEVCLEDAHLSSCFARSTAARLRRVRECPTAAAPCSGGVFQGLTNREIGARLEISEDAVKASVRPLCEKIRVRTRAQLMKVAIEQYRDEL